ncbi:MAG: argininosuccinate lyase, partial [Acidimicrobiia bacterium]|nr:argininosuccinate lyase [Acidimicrobiia bacterium]
PPAPSSWVVALDLAEALVARGVPFREAHRAVGGLVANLKAEGRDFTGVTAADLKATHPLLLSEDLDLLDPRGSVEARRSPRGGSFASVAEQIEELRTILP